MSQELVQFWFASTHTMICLALPVFGMLPNA